MIYARMYIGEYITVVPYLEVIWCIPFQLYNAREGFHKTTRDDGNPPQWTQGL